MRGKKNEPWYFIAFENYIFYFKCKVLYAFRVKNTKNKNAHKMYKNAINIH